MREPEGCSGTVVVHRVYFAADPLTDAVDLVMRGWKSQAVHQDH
jgi:hypothetical protein